MAGPVFFALVSNADPQTRRRVAEALATELAAGGLARPVFFNFDHGSPVRTKAGKQFRDDPVARYGNTLGSSGIPVLKPLEAAAFLEDAVKSRNASLSDGRAFITLMNEVPPPDAIPLFDALCFAVTLGHASTAFVYGAVKTMEAAGRTIPMRVMVVGEPRIEKNAEFYASMAEELHGVGKGFKDLSYAGFVSFDKEESSLASQYGMTVLQAFPEGSTRGQVKQAVRKLFANDFSELCADWIDRERNFLAYLRAEKYA